MSQTWDSEICLKNLGVEMQVLAKPAKFEPGGATERLRKNVASIV